jgi:hypothetical protein
VLLLVWSPPDHLWIGRKIAAIPAISAMRLVTKARTSVLAEILALSRAAGGENSAGFPEIYATFQRDNLRRRF